MTRAKRLAQPPVTLTDQQLRDMVRVQHARRTLAKRGVTTQYMVAQYAGLPKNRVREATANIRAVLRFTLADARAAVALLSKETPDYAAE